MALAGRDRGGEPPAAPRPVRPGRRRRSPPANRNQAVPGRRPELVLARRFARRARHRLMGGLPCNFRALKAGLHRRVGYCGEGAPIWGAKCGGGRGEGLAPPRVPPYPLTPPGGGLLGPRGWGVII